MTSNFRKFIVVCVVWLAIFIPTTLIKIDIPCVQCGITSYSENIWCRIATRFNMNYMHYHCADDYCRDNPVDWGKGVVIGEDGERFTLEYYQKLKSND